MLSEVVATPPRFIGFSNHLQPYIGPVLGATLALGMHCTTAEASSTRHCWLDSAAPRPQDKTGRRRSNRQRLSVDRPPASVYRSPATHTRGLSFHMGAYQPQPSDCYTTALPRVESTTAVSFGNLGKPSATRQPMPIGPCSTTPLNAGLKKKRRKCCHTTFATPTACHLFGFFRGGQI